MGPVVPDRALDINTWGEMLSNPVGVGQEIIYTMILALFKGIAVMYMTIMLFVMSAIREFLTLAIAAALPFILVLDLIPQFKNATKLILDSFTGLIIAPIFSALFFALGLAWLESENMGAMEYWFASLGIGFLVVFFPFFLSPLLGKVANGVSQMQQTAMQGAMTVGSVAGLGMVQGMQSAQNAMNPQNLIGKNGKNAQGSFTNESLNTATQGAGVNMGKMDKFKTYAKAGMKGMGAGFAEGGLKTAPSMIGVPGMQTGDVGQQIHGSIDQAGVDAVHGTHISNASDKVGNDISSVQTQTIINPDNARLGQQMVTDSAMQQEFASANVKGFENMSPNMQQQAVNKISKQIMSHPESAGHLFNEIKSSSGTQTRYGELG